jgi:hypothetical protein
MIEEEAKTKWCPFGKRYISDEFASGTGMTAINEPESDFRQSCIASDCMMWVWDRKKGGTYSDTSEQAKAVGLSGYLEATVSIGHCGLAK